MGDPSAVLRRTSIARVPRAEGPPLIHRSQSRASGTGSPETNNGFRSNIEGGLQPGSGQERARGHRPTRPHPPPTRGHFGHHGRLIWELSLMALCRGVSGTGVQAIQCVQVRGEGWGRTVRGKPRPLAMRLLWQSLRRQLLRRRQARSARGAAPETSRSSVLGSGAKCRVRTPMIGTSGNAPVRLV